MISKLFLLSGNDLPLTDRVYVRHPTVDDVLTLNQGFLCEELYWTYVSSILSDPYDYMVWLADQGIDYETYSDFDVFLLRWNEANISDSILQKDKSSANMMRDAMNFFFGKRNFSFVKVEGRKFFIDVDDPEWFIDENAFNIACEFIATVNCLEKTDRIKPATPGHKKILIQDMREEQKRKAKSKTPQKPVTHIADALATVLSGGSGAITPTNYNSTHIYQLLSSSRAVQKKMVVQSLLNGIYTGMIKGDKIADNELRWV